MFYHFAIILLGLSFALQQAKAAVTPLVKNDLKSLYQNQTKHTPGENFGIYKMERVGDKIYLGLGTDRPATMDGAMLASLPLGGGNALKEAYLNEQGLIDMMVAGDSLHIPGADPGYPEFGWDSGNWYRFNFVEKNPKLELKRNLPFVVHGWGQWFDEKNQTIYHATSQVTCDEPSAAGDCYRVEGAKGHGALFKTTDFGDSWQEVAGIDDGIGNYRTYDVAGTENALFATWADNTPEGTMCGLAVKKNDVSGWTRVKYMEVACLERLVTLGSSVLTLSRRGPFLLAISDIHDPTSDEPYLAIQLPARAHDNSYNHLAVNDEDFEIFFASTKGIYSTKDLKDWSLLKGTEFLDDVRDMVYIGEKNLLLVATPTQVYSVDY